MTSIARRTLLTGGLVLAAAPAFAAAPQPWLAYEDRLRDRLANPPDGDFDEEFERTLLDLNNIIRDRQGLPPLARDRGLTLAARAHAGDMAATGRLDHHTPEGYSAAGRVGLLARDLVGVAGENIAMREKSAGAVGPDELMTQWRESPGHRANLLAREFTHAGFGVLVQGQGHRAIAVGVYADVAARLIGPAPLRVRTPDEIARALSRTETPIRRFSVAQPDGEAMITTYVDGHPEARQPALLPGAWQLRPHLSSGEHRSQVAWGPVFVLG
jgi:uncharacterized protein YkwD